MKYILFLLPSLVFANGNHEENSHKTYYQDTYVENTYIQYKTYDSALAAQAAISSIPSLSHRTGHDSHTGLGFGAGFYEGKQGLGITLEHQTSCATYKINAAAAGKEQIYSFGVMVGF